MFVCEGKVIEKAGVEKSRINYRDLQGMDRKHEKTDKVAIFTFRTFHVVTAKMENLGGWCPLLFPISKDALSRSYMIYSPYKEPCLIILELPFRVI